MDDDILHPEPVYAISRTAAPGGVPLTLTICCLLPVMLLTLFVSPFFVAVLPFGWRRLQKWINGDMKKPQIAFLRWTGAAMSADPRVIRADGTAGRQWGGSTVTALAIGTVGGLPRHIELPED